VAAVGPRKPRNQIIGMIKEQGSSVAQNGLAGAEVCRDHGLSPASFYKLKAKYGGMEVSDARRRKSLEEAEYLDNDKMIAGYLSDALETQDAAFIADAIGVVARAKGMKRVAEDAGVSRESLYRALSASGNPEFGTVLKVLASLNIKLVAQPGRHRLRNGIRKNRGL